MNAESDDPQRTPKETTGSFLTDSQLANLLVEAKAAEYRELCDRWRDLDSKAQALITLTGVLLTGFLAYTGTKTASLTTIEKVWSAFVILLFVGSVLASAIELWIRQVGEPPHVEFMDNLVERLLRTEDEKRIDREYDINLEVLAEWKKVNSEVRSVIETKVKALLWGQALTAAPVILLIIPAAVILTR